MSNHTVIQNGKTFDTDSNIQIALRNTNNSKPYYQYEKITDQNVINKYKEIKSKNGNYLDLQSMLKTTAPSSNWTAWEFWSGYDFDGTNGHGFTQRNISVPDTGLYYMWLYFSGKDVKNIYGYILVDNLQPDIALESISLSKTATVELGKTLTLSPTFNPSGATNKIVTWSSSDEAVATVDNAGKITPKKLGSTIITVTSKDGNKKATCTVTVTEAQNNNQNNTNNGGNSNNGGSNNNNQGTNNGGSTTNKGDTTTATGKLPQTGLGIGLTCAMIAILAIGILIYHKYNRLKDI